MKKIIIPFLFLVAVIAGCTSSPEYNFESGVVIAHSPTKSKRYIGSPSIAILPSGKYIASHDFFGPNSKNNTTVIYESEDKGVSWKKISRLEGQWWSNLFYHQNNLYIMGTTKEYGYCVIRKSVDEGKTWTEPVDSLSGLLLGNSEYHTSAMPVLYYNGRIWRAMEERNPPEKWGVNFLSFVMSAPENADLLKASNWKRTNALRYNQKWEGRAWLEGNVLLNPKGEIVNILRCAIDKNAEEERACVINISANGVEAKFDSVKGFISFPGGSKKFTIRYDKITKQYWSLTNYIPDEFKGYDPAQTRNTLALVSSSDLENWEVKKIILQDKDVQHVGFQYADWLIEGNDIISVIRTAYFEKDGTPAHRAHDANYLLFLRIENFRK